MLAGIGIIHIWPVILELCLRNRGKSKIKRSFELSWAYVRRNLYCMFVGCSSTLNDTSITLDTARRRKQDDGGSLGK